MNVYIWIFEMFIYPYGYLPVRYEFIHIDNGKKYERDYTSYMLLCLKVWNIKGSKPDFDYPYESFYPYNMCFPT